MYTINQNNAATAQAPAKSLDRLIDEFEDSFFDLPEDELPERDFSKLPQIVLNLGRTES